EAACISSGLVQEGAGKVRIAAISGPGACGADYPIRVSSLGESPPLAFGSDLRPPGSIPNASMPQRWPGTGTYPPSPYEGSSQQPHPSPRVEARPLGAPGAAPPYEPLHIEEPLSLDPHGSAGAARDRGPYGAAPPPLAGTRPVQRVP